MKSIWSKYGPRLLGAVAACGVLALLLGNSVGSLARPERLAGQDRRIGFQLVYEEIQPPDRSVVVGEYDAEEDRYVFPGREGLNCFLALRAGPDGETDFSGWSDMVGAEVSLDVSPGGGEQTLSGTFYKGPILEGHESRSGLGYALTAYWVYQAQDGTVYLSGEQQGFGGGGGITVSMEEVTDWVIGGSRRTDRLAVEFSIQWEERTEQVEVVWYDGADSPLARRALTMEEIGDGLALERPEGAVWALVTVTDRRGGVERAAYTLDGPIGAFHRLIQLDERGSGRVADLELN